MAPSPARRRRLLARTASGRGTDYARSHPAYAPRSPEQGEPEKPFDVEEFDDEEIDADESDERAEEPFEESDPTDGDRSTELTPTAHALLPPPRLKDEVLEEFVDAVADATPALRERQSETRLPDRSDRPLSPVASNPGPLPQPLPPRLDAVVRRLREDLIASGGEAAGLADEICARHRDRLREALGLDD